MVKPSSGPGSASVSTRPGAGRGGSVLAVTGGLCALLAGACWIGKGAGVLLTGSQPPVLFELAPLLMAVAVAGLAWQLPASRGRTVGCLAAALGGGAAVPVVLDEVVDLPTAVAGTGMALAHLSVLVGLAGAGAHLRRERGDVLPLALAVVTVPAVVAGGGLAAVLGDRALEVPIVGLGVCWVLLGVRLLGRANLTGAADR